MQRQPLLGGSAMSADPSVCDSNNRGDEPRIEQARALCAEALQICDALELSPEIGARLQDVIIALEERLRERRS